MRGRFRRPALFALFALAAATSASAAGARHFKSGPIQITADGVWVWSVNPDNDSVTRLDTRTDAVAEYRLPSAGGPHRPLGLSLKEDGTEVWVACHDSDRLLVLRGLDGQLLGQVGTGWGSGPYGIAIAPDQRRALVTLHRAAATALIDLASRSVLERLEPMYWSPLGVAWMEDGVSAWVTHLFADGEDPSISRIELSGSGSRVTTRLLAKSTNPKHSTQIAAPHDIAEGGYLTFRGHLAQIPSASGRNAVWLPTQYNNINETRFTPDSTIQSTIRHVDLPSRSIPNTNNDKVILTAVHVHDPQSSNGATYVGPGWDARISGPIDIGFSSDGQTAWMLNEQSNDLIVVPVSTPAVKPAAAAPLTEIAVGWKPIGLAISPVADLGYVANQLSRSISVVDLQTGAERAIAATPLTGEPFAPAELSGARIFHSSVDPGGLGRISANHKVACASCHPHAEHDGRIWDFENLPGNHGPRDTMSLLGVAATHTPGGRDPINNTWGLLHRSGDRDELQDFEHTFRGVNMGGVGFLGAAVNGELAAPNAGRDPDLDALATYLQRQAPVPKSPHRTTTGQLSEAAVRGATFFVGTNRAARRGDSGCVSCHVPETAFADGTSHNVGSRQPGSENELNSRNPAWTVNTPTLVGAWTSPPYTGVATHASSLVELVKDAASRATAANPHGTPDGLTGRQIADLAAFLGSIDGGTTAAEVRGARDTTAPRVLRVEAASLTRINVWFSETIDPVSSTVPASWRLVDLGTGQPVPISAIAWDAQNGDRIDLSVALAASCAGQAYRLEPAGAIADVADWASGGSANLVDPGEPGNQHIVTLGTTLTVTLGASGYENISVPVHDSGMVGPSLADWGHDSPWLFVVTGVTPNVSNKGFVRFDWAAPFAAQSGVTSGSDILDASFSLVPEWGDAQELQVRRCLQSWSDTPTGADWNSNPTGAPSWTYHSSRSLRWNTQGARAVGGTGTVAGDYNASFDVSGVVDAVATMPAINEPVWFGGATVTDAFRFWFQNPALDYGYAVELAPGSVREAKFDRSETELRQHGPVLRITYSLGNLGPAAPGEVSGPGSGKPLWAVKAAGGAVLASFEDAAAATSYSIYEGSIGSWFSHAGVLCNDASPLVAGRRETSFTPGSARAYFMVTGANSCAEGPAAAGWPAGRNDCPP